MTATVSEVKTEKSALAIFDLDNTLIAGDSDHAWGEFLIQQQLVDGEQHRRKNDAFYADYLRGELDMQAYLRFALAAIAGKTPEELKPLHKEFMRTVIEPLRLPAADQLLQQHRKQNHFLLIITATNRFITGPIAQWLGVDALLASDVELKAGRYTGQPQGVPCYHEGKVTRLNDWLKHHSPQIFNLQETYFYSDSHNDIPLLDSVGHPVAVDPDDTLRAHAQTRQWPVITLRN